MPVPAGSHALETCPHIFGNAAVEGAEDPERILEQAVTDMNNDIIKLRQATAKVNLFLHCWKACQLMGQMPDC